MLVFVFGACVQFVDFRRCAKRFNATDQDRDSASSGFFSASQEPGHFRSGENGVQNPNDPCVKHTSGRVFTLIFIQMQCAALCDLIDVDIQHG
jgi:hypothetical protein